MTDTVILCVDDDEVVLESIKEQLKRKFGNKYLYEVADSAEEGWEIIEELSLENLQIVIVVSDWLMPEMKGDEFLIKVHQKFPGVTNIMLTGQADESAVERAKKDANLFYCLQKPWSEAELTDVLTSALEMYEPPSDPLR
ncbi:MAG: response regulator [Spirulinaceae cyanobacterium]